MPRRRATQRAGRPATAADEAAMAEFRARAVAQRAQAEAQILAAQQFHAADDDEEEEEEEEDDDGEEQTENMEDEDEETDAPDDSNVEADMTADEPSHIEPDHSLDDLKEIGNLASWTVSTAKPGCGVAALRSDDVEQFWQSDGPQPHFINIHFAKRVFVKKIRIYLDYNLDESYTPTKMSILSGTGYHNLQEVTTMSFEQPAGWLEVDLSDVHEDGMLRTFLIQIGIHANHQNGKDTHVRGLQIFSPIRLNDPGIVSLEAGFNEASVSAKTSKPLTAFGFGTLGGRTEEIPFSTVEFLSETEVR